MSLALGAVDGASLGDKLTYLPSYQLWENLQMRNGFEKTLIYPFWDNFWDGIFCEAVGRLKGVLDKLKVREECGDSHGGVNMK